MAADTKPLRDIADQLDEVAGRLRVMSVDSVNRARKDVEGIPAKLREFADELDAAKAEPNAGDPPQS